jgi:cobalt-zinc-cadmium resistance protein CzcA
MLLKNFPEMEQVVSKIGSAEIPTDPMPMEVADVMIILKPKSEWTSANNKEEMMAKMDKVLNDLPGVTTEFTQPVQMRFNELMTGVRSDVAIKIFGEDIELLAGLAEEVVPIVQRVERSGRCESRTGIRIATNHHKIQ